jgi:O-antigen ligase
MIGLLLAVVYLGLAVAWSRGTWSISAPQFGVLFTGALAIVREFPRRAPIKWTPAVWIAMLLVLWGPIQLLLNVPVSRFDTGAATLGWFVLAIILVLASKMLTTANDLNRFISLNLWLGCTLAILCVLQHISAPRLAWWTFPTGYAGFGPFIYKNQFAALLELLIPLAFYRMATEPARRLLYGLLLAALIACMVASESRAGLIVAAGELVFLFGLSIKRRLMPVRVLASLAVPIVILMVLFVLIVGWEGMWRRFQEPSPWDVRAKLARSTLQMAAERPLLGWGLGNWRTAYPAYALFDNAAMANEAHNDWFQWAAEGGLPFALLFLALAVLATRRVWRHYWGFGVTAVFVHCFVDYPTRDPAVAAIIFLFTGALIGAPQIRERRAKRKAPATELVGTRG